MLHPQRKTMDLVPLVCLCLLTWSAGTAADHKPVVVNVEPGSDVILPCSLSTQQSLTSEFFEWKKDQKQVFLYDAGVHSNNNPTGQDKQFKDRVFFFSDQLKNGNASIEIRNTQLADIGNYTCDFPRLRPPQTFYIKLVFGAAPKPSVTILDATTNWVLLYCEGFGNPLPELEWKDSAGNTLPAERPQVSDRGGRPYITVKTTVTKTDNFSCAATQKTIYHTISNNIYVRLNGADSKDRSEKNVPEPVVVNVELGSDVILPCSLSTQEIPTHKHFEWKKDQKQVFFYDEGTHSNNNPTGQDEQFKGRVFHLEDQLKNGIASIKIRDTQLADSGIYTCVFPRLQPPQTFYIKLVFGGVLKDRSDKNIGAAKPSVRQVLTKDGMLLQCVVRGASLKPKVEWKDSAGNILLAEELPAEKGSYDIILQTPVTKIDNFTCVVTQEELIHQSSVWTYAAPHEKTSNNWTGVVIGIIATLIVVGIVGIVLAVRARSERSNTAANCSYGDNRNSGINGQAEENIHLSSPETKSASKDQDNTPV